MRRPPATDIGVAYTVFIMEEYRFEGLPHPDQTLRIVDLGANVGYSVIYWATRYAHAQIEAFEPHPEHQRILMRHLEVNGLRARVTCHPVAVGVAPGRACLTNDSGRSRIAPDGEIKVEMVDFFEAMSRSNQRIDLLKIDIEGGEYAILMDPRLADLDIGVMVFEWEQTAEVPDADKRIFGRLKHLGWELSYGPRGEWGGRKHGTVYARRTTRQ